LASFPFPSWPTNKPGRLPGVVTSRIDIGTCLLKFPSKFSTVKCELLGLDGVTFVVWDEVGCGDDVLLALERVCLAVGVLGVNAWFTLGAWRKPSSTEFSTVEEYLGRKTFWGLPRRDERVFVAILVRWMCEQWRSPSFRPLPVTSSDNVCRLKTYTLARRNKFQARLGLRDRERFFSGIGWLGQLWRKPCSRLQLENAVRSSEWDLEQM
jgi:hypothetical protein